MPIPNQFFFFWGTSTALPYVRYLTMATARYHHPNSAMFLYECKCNDKDKWGQGIFCDFQFNSGELNKIYEKLDKEGVKIPENIRDLVYNILLGGKEPASWDSIKYDNRAIENALRTQTTIENITDALNKVVETRKARELKRPVKHNYIQDAVERLGYN